jgi:HD superfamily phosphodiesterase
MNLKILNKLLQYVLTASTKYNIDETHSLGHSLNVLFYANQIYNSEKKIHPIIKKHKNIIYASAILHDTCDKKYVNEKEGLDEIERLLFKNTPLKIADYSAEIFGYSMIGKSPDSTNGSNHDISFNSQDINIIKQIISTMSYSKVKKNGFPDLGAYQYAYHIVREADLLAAYDFDRCILYDMHRNAESFENAYNNACSLFENRVLRHNDDKLFVTEYSKKKSLELHELSLQRMKMWRSMFSTRKSIM